MRPELAENDVHPKERETARHGGPRKVLGLRRPVGRPLPQCPGPAEPPTTHAAREGKETDRSDRAAGVPGGRFGDRRISTSHGAMEAALAVAGRYVLVTVPSRRVEPSAVPSQCKSRPGYSYYCAKPMRSAADGPPDAWQGSTCLSGAVPSEF